jgi:NAD(P)-dependent dehydrogenase (short-subunit alcohol dehydrogenase family)
MPLQLTFPQGATLVSGGTGRVGEGIVRALAGAGVPLVFTYRSTADKAAALEDELRAAGAAIRACQMDNGDAASIDRAIALAEEMAGALRTVIWSGGPVFAFDKLADIPPEVAGQFLQDDAMGAYRLVSRAVPKLRANGGGSITLCTTIANRRVVDLDGLSPFSKSAVEAMVRQIAAEEAGSRIRCNAVAVSWVTPLTKDQQIAEMAALPPADRDRIVGVIEHMAAGTRMDRPQLPIECGCLFAFLASEQAACITGQSVAFDGGFAL